MRNVTTMTPAEMSHPAAWNPSRPRSVRILNADRQVGGSIGLAVLGTVAWTVVADAARAHAAAARTASWQAAYQHAPAAGFDRAFLVASGIALLILVVAITVIRVRRADLSGS